MDRTSRSAAFILALVLAHPAGHAGAQPAPAPFAAPAPAAATAPAIPEADPRKTAALAPATWYRWTARNGPKEPDGDPRPLHFAYRLPADFDPAAKLTPRSVCVFLPDLGGDHASLAAAIGTSFRPSDVLVTIDGVSSVGATFTGESAEGGVFRGLLLELPRHFATARLVLIGHGQGGLFACHYSSEMGRMIDGGVVACGSGVWNWSRTENPQFRAVPTVLVHSTSDPLRPYYAAALTRDGLSVAGADLLALRRLSGESSFDVSAICGAVDWCLAMRAEKPADALSAIRAMLEAAAGKPAPLGMARRALRRFEGKDPAFKPPIKPDDPAVKEAWDLSVAIEARAQKHVDALRARLRSPADLKPPIDAADGAWIGHLLAVREDMRGVDAVEGLVADIGFEAAAGAHAKEAAQLLLVLESDAPPKEIFARAVESLPKCFLFDGLPFDLADRLRAWRKAADANALTPESLAAYDKAQAVLDARAAGQAAYEELCKK